MENLYCDCCGKLLDVSIVWVITPSGIYFIFCVPDKQKKIYFL